MKLIQNTFIVLMLLLNGCTYVQQDKDNWVYTGNALSENSKHITNVSSKEVQVIIAALKEKGNKHQSAVLGTNKLS